jgi:teichuronic acid biosynthesis glycosyltransferase TuaH
LAKSSTIQDIIIFSSSRADDVLSSTAFCLANEFSKSHRVFYINHPRSIKDIICSVLGKDSSKSRREYGDLQTSLTFLTPQLTLPINWLSNLKLYNLFSQVNEKIVCIALKRLIKKKQIKNYIFINIFDPFFLRSIPKNIQPVFYIYYCVDDITQERYISKHGSRLERELASKSDAVLVTSRELQKIQLKNSSKVYYLPNAADTIFFNRAVTQFYAKPVEIRDVTKKIIIYVGNVGPRLNYNLLKKISNYHRDKLILMIGPINFSNSDFIAFESYKNIRFIGPKSMSEIPSYLQYSDCAIIPFELNILTKSIYPLKINEYLAAGRPVVSSCFSEDISEFSKVIYAARNDDEFVRMIDIAINENSTSKISERVNHAIGNTWEKRVSTFWKVIDEINSL